MLQGVLGIFTLCLETMSIRDHVLFQDAHLRAGLRNEKGIRCSITAVWWCIIETVKV